MEQAQRVIDKLLDTIIEDCPIELEVDWNQLSEESQLDLRWQMFRLKYGEYPSTYIYKVKKILENYG